MEPASPISTLPEVTTVWNRNFICAVITNLALTLGHFSVNTHVATYATFLNAGPIAMGLLTSMFFGISFLLKPVTGPAMTKIDKRKLMIMVFAVGGVANLGYALFHSIGMFVVFRIINGIQYGFIGSLIMTVSSDSLPRDKMASGMGIYGVGGAIGAAVGPSIGHWLYEIGTQLKGEDFGYTLIFLFASVILFLGVIPSVILHPDKKTKEQVASTGVWYKNIVTVHALPTMIVLFFIILSYSTYNSYMFNLGADEGSVISACFIR
jgi:MFS family permease